MSKMMSLESTAVSITMPGQGTVLADRHENLLQGLSSWQIWQVTACSSLPGAPALQLSSVSTSCSGPPGARGC